MTVPSVSFSAASQVPPARSEMPPVEAADIAAWKKRKKQRDAEERLRLKMLAEPAPTKKGYTLQQLADAMDIRIELLRSHRMQFTKIGATPGGAYLYDMEETRAWHLAHVLQSGQEEPVNPKARPTKTPKTESAAVRAWAAMNGYKIGERGRPSGTVLEAYRTAQHRARAVAVVKKEPLAPEGAAEPAVSRITLDEDRLIKIDELAAWLQVSKWTIYRDIEKMGLPHLRIGGIRFRVGAIRAWLIDQERRTDGG